MIVHFVDREQRIVGDFEDDDGDYLQEKNIPATIFFSNKSGEKMGINYAFDCANGKTYGYEGACHAGMECVRAWTQGQALVKYHSQLRKGSTNYQDALLWWNTIFNPEHSPWASVLKDVTFIEDGGEKIAFSMPVDAETNNQMLVNFSVATRLPFEHRVKLNAFLSLMKIGKLTPPQCIAAALYAGGDDNALFVHMYDNGHCPVNVHNFDYKMLAEKRPDINHNLLLFKDNGYSPNNKLWESMSNQGMGTIWRNFILNYKSAVKAEVQLGPFHALYTKYCPPRDVFNSGVQRGTNLQYSEFWQQEFARG